MITSLSSSFNRLQSSRWAQCTSQHGSFLSTSVAGSPVIQATIAKATFYFSALQFCCTVSIQFCCMTALFLFIARTDSHSSQARILLY